MGEIQRITPLSAAQIDVIMQDSTKLEEVCPGGSVVCGRCDVPFQGHSPEVILPDFGELDKRLPETKAS